MIRAATVAAALQSGAKIQSNNAGEKNVRTRQWIACLLLVIALFTPVMNDIYPQANIRDLLTLVNVTILGVAFGLNGFRIPTPAFHIILPFILIFFVGLASSSVHDPFNIYRDAWYALHPAVVLLEAFLLGHLIRDLGKLLFCVLLVATLSAIQHLYGFTSDPGLLAQSVLVIRRAVGIGHFSSAVALGILFAMAVQGLSWRKVSLLLCLCALVLCSMSQVLAFTRMLWISLFIMILAGAGLFDFRRSRYWLPFPILGVAAMIVIIATVDLKSLLPPDSYFVFKIVNSINEVTPRSFDSLQDVNENWRGYEAYRGFALFRSGDWYQILFGRGLGTTTDLGLFIRLGVQDITFRVVPWVHNGFVYILIKTGVVGLVLYLSFFAVVFRYGMRGYSLAYQSRAVKFLNAVMLGTLLAILVSTPVFSGAFERARFINGLMFIAAALAIQCQLVAQLHQPRRIRLRMGSVRDPLPPLGTPSPTSLTSPRPSF